MNSLEEAKEFLRKDVAGSNLYDHISDVLLEVITKRPENALELFEQLSSSVKQKKFTPSEPIEASDDPEPRSLSTRHAATQYCKAIAALHKMEGVEEDEEPEDEVDEPLPPPKAEIVEDIVSSSANWEAAGVCFSQEDTFKLLLAMARHAGSDDSIETLRFWGKLQGRNQDYFVFQGVGGASEEEEEEEEEKREEAEAEANKHSYWVCNYVGGPWFKLPNVKPSAVLKAQQIRRFLTGDLSAPVCGYPPFPGCEKHYVRAIIALIDADCSIAPKGYFKLEDNGGTSLDEAYEGGQDLSSAGAWETYGLKFNSLGRVTSLEQQDESGNPVTVPEGWTTEWLSACNEEEWTIRKSPAVLEGSKSLRVVLRSKRWPGAYAIGSASGSWSNIYVGFGTPSSDQAYTPTMPPPLQPETHATELKEQEDVREDPTPPEEPVEE